MNLLNVVADDYFLSNVQTIDDITEEKKKKLFSMLRWPPTVQAAICIWPCFNIIREVSVLDTQSKNCSACGRLGFVVRVLMYGQPYNSTTLEGCQPDPNAINEKVKDKLQMTFNILLSFACNEIFHSIQLFLA